MKYKNSYKSRGIASLTDGALIVAYALSVQGWVFFIAKIQSLSESVYCREFFLLVVVGSS